MSIFTTIAKIAGKGVLSFLPGGTLIPTVLEGAAEIAGIIGGKTADKINTGLEAVAEGLTEVGNSTLTESQRVQLFELKASREVKLKEIALAELKLEYTDAATSKEVIKAALESGDEYVRRARPQMMKRMGYAAMGYAFFAPAILVYLSTQGATEASVTQISSLMTYVGAFLMTSFTTAFTGYTVARSRDKRAALGQSPPGLLQTISGIIKLPALLKK